MRRMEQTHLEQTHPRPLPKQTHPRPLPCREGSSYFPKGKPPPSPLRRRGAQNEANGGRLRARNSVGILNPQHEEVPSERSEHKNRNSVASGNTATGRKREQNLSERATGRALSAAR